MPGPSTDDLKRSPLFCELTRKELGRVASAMKTRSFDAGTEIATEGQVGVGFFLIEEGRVGVFRGGERIGELGPHDYFGEIALIVESPRTATVVAETELRCYAMTSWEFRKLVESNSSVSWHVLQAMARRLLKLEQQQS